MGNRHIKAQEGGPRKLHFWDFFGDFFEYLVSKRRAKTMHVSKRRAKTVHVSKRRAKMKLHASF
jgi:hypothetical protein